MGHRANFLVIESGSAKAFFDNWGAMGCIYSFAAGPAAAAEALTGMEVVNELLDWSFAEGGYLIDHDKQVAIVFGIPFDDSEVFEQMPQDAAEKYFAIDEALMSGEHEYLTHISPHWKGWKITWDYRGVDAFGVHLQERGIKGVKLQAPSFPDSTPPAITVEG